MLLKQAVMDQKSSICILFLIHMKSKKTQLEDFSNKKYIYMVFIFYFYIFIIN